MKLQTFLIILAVCAILLWLGWWLVVDRIDPTEGGWWPQLLFYGNLMLAICGSLTLLGYGLRRWRQPDELAYRLVVISLRQGIWFSLLIFSWLWLQSQRILTWWNALLLIIVLTVLEFFFISFRKTE